jgi:hypothetical protein
LLLYESYFVIAIRLRVDANNSTKKTIDPRFSDISGKMDEKIFAKNYSFLDDYRDNEIAVISKVVKKTKSAAKKEELKAELLKYVEYIIYYVVWCLHL